MTKPIATTFQQATHLSKKAAIQNSRQAWKQWEQSTRDVYKRQPVLSLVPPTFNALASDSLGSSGQGQGLAYDGYQIYGTVGEQCTTPGKVLAIVSGVGSIAILSVQLRSGLIVQVPSGSCTTPNNMGNGPSAQ